MRKILLLSNTPAHLIELMRVARALNKSERFQPNLLFTYFPSSKDLNECRINAIAAWDSYGRLFTLPEENNDSPTNYKEREIGSGSIIGRCWLLFRGAPQKLKRALYNGAYFFIDSFFFLPFWLFYYTHRYRFARKTITAYDLLILAEDNVGYETGMWIKAANESNIPVMITPFTIANATEPAEAHYQNPAYNLKRFTNRIAGYFYPKWIYGYKERKLLRLPAARVFAQEWLKFSPSIPWMINSGNIDAIAVESEIMSQFYKDEGIRADRLVITGSLSDDALSECFVDRQARRDSLCTELGIDPAMPLILCALPPDQFSLSKAQTDFDGYDELIQFWVKSLSAIASSNVVVKLHPRSNYDDLKYIGKWGVAISQRDTAELIPLCDIFVASVSATIRWAIACGIPVLNYDVYRLGYKDYDDVPGVLKTEEQAEFQSFAAKLVSDTSYYSMVAGYQKSVMSQWGNLDGKSTQRVLSLCDQFISSKRRNS